MISFYKMNTNEEILTIINTKQLIIILVSYLQINTLFVSIIGFCTRLTKKPNGKKKTLNIEVSVNIILESL